MPPASKVVVRLTDEQRDALEQLLRTGSCSAAMRRRRLSNAVSISSSKRGQGQSGVSCRAMNT